MVWPVVYIKQTRFYLLIILDLVLFTAILELDVQMCNYNYGNPKAPTYLGKIMCVSIIY